MPYDISRDYYRAQSAEGPARNFYSLTDAMIGNVELPAYGRSFRVQIGATATPPCILVVVPIGELDDNVAITISVTSTETILFGVRRIVSINGGATLPTGVQIQIVTV